MGGALWASDLASSPFGLKAGRSGLSDAARSNVDRFVPKGKSCKAATLATSVTSESSRYYVRSLQEGASASAGTEPKVSGSPTTTAVTWHTSDGPIDSVNSI